MDAQPLYVHLTHKASVGSKPVAYGAMVNGHTIWRLPVEQVIGLLRNGVKFFVSVCGRASEVQLRQSMLNEQGRLSVVGDSATVSQLAMLPEFPSES